MCPPDVSINSYDQDSDGLDKVASVTIEISEGAVIKRNQYPSFEMSGAREQAVQESEVSLQTLL
jgi:hypothetical protein